MRRDRPLPQWDPPLICQECHQLFERPVWLEAWKAATRCGECMLIDRLERPRRLRIDVIQILHPLFMDVDRVIERKPGDPGWVRGELGL